MPRKKEQVLGQIELFLSVPEQPTVKTKSVRKKTSTKAKTNEPEKKTKNPSKDSEPAKTTQKKKYTQAQYRAAVEIAEECGVVNAGKLINRFRIPAIMALDILAKMQEEGLITEKGTVVKKKGIIWKEK